MARIPRPGRDVVIFPWMDPLRAACSEALFDVGDEIAIHPCKDFPMITHGTTKPKVGEDVAIRPGVEFPLVAIRPKGCYELEYLGESLVNPCDAGANGEQIIQMFKLPDGVTADFTDPALQFIVESQVPVKMKTLGSEPCRVSDLNYNYGACTPSVSEDGGGFSYVDGSGWGCYWCFKSGVTEYVFTLGVDGHDAALWAGMNEVTHMNFTLHNAGHPYFNSCFKFRLLRAFICP